MSFSLGRKRPMTQLAEGLFYAQVYWTLGPGPKDALQSEVADPPNSGWGTCMVIPEGDDRLRLFSTWHLKSWVVSTRCHEAASLSGTWDDEDGLRARLKERLPVYYAAHRLKGWESDFATAERVMGLLGIPVPTEDEWLRLAPSAARHVDTPGEYAVTPDGAEGSHFRRSAAPKAKAVGGKAPEPSVGGLKKPVKREGRKGEVLAFLMEAGGAGSVAAATERFGISRSNLLSQLFLLRKEHNIGYTVNGDAVSVQLPSGCTDPFADKQGD